MSYSNSGHIFVIVTLTMAAQLALTARGGEAELLPTGGPNGGPMFDFVQVNDFTIVGTRHGVYRSNDQGETWHFLGQANKSSAERVESAKDLLEHSLIERSDGVLWMLVRTPPGIGKSHSSDGGRSWSPVENSGIRHPLSRFFIRRLNSGRILLIRHDPPSITYPADCDDCGELNRSHLTAYLSNDDGRSWDGGLLLDERETVSYPDGVEGQDGRIFIIYDRNRYTDSEVWMAIFAEQDVLNGSCITKDCRLRVNVSQPAN